MYLSIEINSLALKSHSFGYSTIILFAHSGKPVFALAAGFVNTHGTPGE